MRSGNSEAERGTAVVEYLGAAVLVALSLMLVVQLAVWVWARNVAVSAAHEGARTAAEAGRPVGDGISRARAVLHDGLGRAGGHFVVEGAQDGEEIVVEARGRAPVIVPFLPFFDIDARAVAFDEDAVLP